MCTENEIDRILTQTILADGDICAQSSELISGISGLIQETLGMNVARGLDDAKIDVN
jgi:hypothetical protein